MSMGFGLSFGCARMTNPDPRWLDPSGWRPYALQAGTPPDAQGVPWAQWEKGRVKFDPSRDAAWLSLQQAKDKKTKKR